MKRNVVVSTEASSDRLFEVVADLATYPEWLDIVSSVDVAEPHPDDAGPAWFITLRAQIGRFARSKRLRIVRVESDPGVAATFARRERDDREHSDWDMVALVSPTETGSKLTLDLAYSGRLWSNVLDALLIAQCVVGLTNQFCPA